MSKELLQEDMYQRLGPYHRVALNRFPRHEDIRYHLTNRLLPKYLSGQLCLDFGGGDGAMASFMANRGAEVVVLDPSFTALEYATADDERLRGVQGRTLLPFRDRSFKIVTMLETLEHISDEEERVALGEAFRVLKEDGLFVISVPSVILHIDSRHYRHYSSASLAEKISNVGFTILKKVAYKNLVEGWKNSSIVRKPLKGILYGLDSIIRNVDGKMGLVECSENDAVGFIVLASRKFN